MAMGECGEIGMIKEGRVNASKQAGVQESK